MITKSKLLILLVSLLSLSLAACSGTGRKDYASVQSEINATDTEKVYVYRTKQMMAKFNLMEVKLNDEVVGDIGQGEVASALISDGNNRLDIKVKSPIPGLGLAADPIVFERQAGQSMYFLVNVKEGFFTNELLVLEVTKSGLESQLGD